jgi:hypothetical protein
VQIIDRSRQPQDHKHCQKIVCLLSSPESCHSYADTRDADPGDETTGKRALTAHPTLAWITSDMEKTSSRRVVRSHIMLDYRHKHRIAQHRTARIPAAKAAPLIARRPNRTNDSSFELKNSLLAHRENHPTRMKAQVNANSNDVYL